MVHFRSYWRVHSPMSGEATFTECCLGRNHRVINLGITKRDFLLASHVIILSHVSNSSARTTNKAFMALSLFTAIVASFCTQRSKRPGTDATPKMPITCLLMFSHNFLVRLTLEEF